MHLIGETIGDALVAAQEFEKQHGAVLIHPFGDSDLDRTAKLVAYTLSTYMDSNGSAVPSKATLASGAGLGSGKRAVDAAIDRLEAGGFIEISRSRGGNSNNYRAPDALYTAHLAARLDFVNGADPERKPRTTVRRTAHPGAPESIESERESVTTLTQKKPRVTARDFSEYDR